MKRRDFLKTSFLSLGVASLVGKASGILGSIASAADAALKDSGIKKQGYIHSVKATDAATKKLIADVTKKKKMATKYPGKVPKCDNCKQYEFFRHPLG